MTIEDGALAVENLSRLFAVDNSHGGHGLRPISFTLPPATFFTLLGPSGCGKTTTLRCIAGLEHPDGGRIRSGSQVLFDGAGGINVPVDRRGFGMVFQSYAIWPHMSVFDNVAFPLRVGPARLTDRQARSRRVEEVLASVGLAGFERRSPTELSGGQQQRVALARAIVAKPRVLLLDEPLSNLDARLREEMRAELQKLPREHGLTAVYVTHDQAEALEMSDLIAVLDRGRLMQLGTPRDIYDSPANAFVASFVGRTNLIDVKLAHAAGSDGLASVHLANGAMLPCRLRHAPPIGTALKLNLRPEALSVRPSVGASHAEQPHLPGIVARCVFQGAAMRLEITVGDLLLHADAPVALGLKPGSAVDITFAPDAGLALPVPDPVPR